MSEPQRIIVRAPNWLGDAVMALPAMAAVRRACSGGTLIVAARGSVAPLFAERTQAGADEVVTLDEDREAAQLRDARGDAILLLPNSFGTAWTARRAGIAERWGYGTAGRGVLLTRSIPRPRQRVHQVEYYMTLARGLGFELPEGESATPRIEASAHSRGKADALLAASGLAPGTVLVGFAPGAAYGHAKRWPPERVAQVINGISRSAATAILLGARDDRETGRAIESSLSPGARMVNLIGRTSLRELVGVIARCAAFVSNDSGAMHVAAALRVPLTALFGPTDERVTAPVGDADVILRDVFCRPCMLRECPIDHRCMKRIDVDSVLTSVTRNLAGGARR